MRWEDQEIAGRRSRELSSTKKRLLEVLDAPEKEEMTVGHLYILSSELINTSSVLIITLQLCSFVKCSMEEAPLRMRERKSSKHTVCFNN